jgi:hypothetical protein
MDPIWPTTIESVSIFFTYIKIETLKENTQIHRVTKLATLMDLSLQ